jgi:hypothetical protein
MLMKGKQNFVAEITNVMPREIPKILSMGR